MNNRKYKKINNLTPSGECCNTQIFVCNNLNIGLHWTDLRRCFVIRSSISNNDDNVTYVAAITCRWSQHLCTDVFQCSIRVGAASRVTEWWDGWLKWCDCRVGVQINGGSNSGAEGDKTDACFVAVNVQSGDHPWQKRLHPLKVAGIDTFGRVHNENDVNTTVHWRRWNNNSISSIIIIQLRVGGLQK